MLQQPLDGVRATAVPKPSAASVTGLLKLEFCHLGRAIRIELELEMEVVCGTTENALLVDSCLKSLHQSASTSLSELFHRRKLGHELQITPALFAYEMVHTIITKG